MHIWYKIFTYLFYPFAPIYLLIRQLRNKEDYNGYKEKLSIIKKPRDKGVLIWLHVASVGEAMSVLPLIEKLISDHQVKKILLTTITLSSGNILKKKYSENQKVIHQFLPLDVPRLSRKFLDHWKPNLSIFVDSEIWPNLIFEIEKKNIPLILINARITKKTYKRWMFLKSFANKIFKKFTLTIAANKESEVFLKNLGAKNIKNYGNLKFTNHNTNFNKKIDSAFLNKVKNRKIWCAASTHSPEEVLCAKSHLEIKKEYSDVLTIIIPRHINRVEKVKKDLINLNLKVALLSDINKFELDTDILIVDSYGKSLIFYNIAKYVFLGKSLIEKLANDSGQNPIEPAKLGCKIFHGAHVSNFIEIYSYFKKLNISMEVEDYKKLGLALIDEFRVDGEKNYKIAEEIEDYGHNILNNVIMELKKYI